MLWDHPSGEQQALVHTLHLRVFIVGEKHMISEGEAHVLISGQPL